jgi:hypothetical protein
LKHKRLFSILAVALVLSILMIAIPATPAMADVRISLDITKGEIGDLVTVDGSGFLATVPGFSEYAVNIYFSRDFINIGDDISYYGNIYEIVKQWAVTSSSGSITKSFYVPAVLNESNQSADVYGGTYYVYVTYSDDEEVMAYAEFTVIGISDFGPDGGPVGTTVSIEGVGFATNQAIIAKFDGSAVSITAGDTSFKGTDGSFSLQLEIPEGITGDHTVTISDSSGHSDQRDFEIAPQIALSTTQASANEDVTIFGSGFPCEVGIFVYLDGSQVHITGGDFATDLRGSFESIFKVPDVDQGSYWVEVEDNNFHVATATLEVGAGLTITPVTTAATPGYIGDVVTVSGVGFQANSTITITYTSDPVSFTTVSLADGSFSYNLTVPPSTAGEHSITATDGTNSETVAFFVEATPPVAPLLVAPAAGEKASSEAEFDWGDVTDDSLPMSYELQVATNDQFTTESILVYKTGLTTSQYTLIEAEKLESTEEGAVYYWRVRAKDAASNPSPWTDSSTFTVGFSFSMPTWLMWVLVGVGAVGVFFLGVWVGRRSIPSEDYW